MAFSYLPDFPPETPEIWTVCDGFHPDIYGSYRTGWLAGASSITSVGTGDSFQNVFAYQIADGTSQVLAALDSTGTDKAYVWNGSAWNDRYAVGASEARAFCQVGNTTLMGTGAGGNLMYRDASGTNNFAAVTGGPSFRVASIAVNALNIVMALSSESDAFHTSDTNNPTVYNSGEATSGNVRLTPGNFTTHVAFGNDFICFKQRGVYRAQYVGGTQKWIFTLLDGAKGAWGRSSAVEADGKVYFIGKAGAYSFDGQGFERIDFGIWQTILGDFGGVVAITQDYKETKLIWDPNTRNIFFFKSAAISGSSRPGGVTSCFTYNTVSRKWGRQTRTTDAGTDVFTAVFDAAPLNDYVTSGISGNAGGGPIYKTNVGLMLADVLKIVTTSFNPTDMPGNNYNAKIRTGRYGSRSRMTKIARVIPQWTKSDGAGTDLSTATVKNLNPFTSDAPMEAEVEGTAKALTTDLNRGDYIKSSRFHSFQFQINCEAVIAGVEVEAIDAGRD